MQQPIDVSGLPPESVRAVNNLVDVLREPAKHVDADAVEGIPPSQWPYEEWYKWFRAWIDSHEKREITIDDSREKIYGGRGE